ncbi:unnamed protein product, partial [Medioppia subpectinata]
MVKTDITTYLVCMEQRYCTQTEQAEMEVAWSTVHFNLDGVEYNQDYCTSRSYSQSDSRLILILVCKTFNDICTEQINKGRQVNLMLDNSPASSDINGLKLQSANMCLDKMKGACGKWPDYNRGDDYYCCLLYDMTDCYQYNYKSYCTTMEQAELEWAWSTIYFNLDDLILNQIADPKRDSSIALMLGNDLNGMRLKDPQDCLDKMGSRCATTALYHKGDRYYCCKLFNMIDCYRHNYKNYCTKWEQLEMIWDTVYFDMNSKRYDAPNCRDMGFNPSDNRAVCGANALVCFCGKSADQ